MGGDGDAALERASMAVAGPRARGETRALMVSTRADHPPVVGPIDEGAPAGSAAGASCVCPVVSRLSLIWAHHFPGTRGGAWVRHHPRAPGGVRAGHRSRASREMRPGLRPLSNRGETQPSGRVAAYPPRASSCLPRCFPDLAASLSLLGRVWQPTMGAMRHRPLASFRARWRSMAPACRCAARGDLPPRRRTMR